MTDDEQTAEVMKACKKARVTVHIRGTDERPVVEVRTKDHRRDVVGGVELRRRLAG